MSKKVYKITLHEKEDFQKAVDLLKTYGVPVESYRVKGNAIITSDMQVGLSVTTLFFGRRRAYNTETIIYSDAEIIIAEMLKSLQVWVMPGNDGAGAAYEIMERAEKYLKEKGCQDVI